MTGLVPVTRARTPGRMGCPDSESDDAFGVKSTILITQISDRSAKLIARRNRRYGDVIMSEEKEEDVLELFQAGISVRLIATPRKHFVTCERTQTVSSFMRARGDDFDFYPVVEGNTIIGLLDTSSLGEGGAEDHRLVQVAMNPLSESNLMGHDASVLDYIRQMDVNLCRLIIARQEIIGLVTASDIQRLPVRAALFAMVTQFEMTMTEAIRRETKATSDWLQFLSPRRAEEVTLKIEKAKESESYIDDLLFTQFCDKRDIIMHINSMPIGKNTFSDQLKSIENLRNNLAHANDFASDRTQAMSLCKIVGWIGEWSRFLKTAERHSTSLIASEAFPVASC